jgi:hypothetical protein
VNTELAYPKKNRYYNSKYKSSPDKKHIEEVKTSSHSIQKQESINHFSLDINEVREETKHSDGNSQNLNESKNKDFHISLVQQNANSNNENKADGSNNNNNIEKKSFVFKELKKECNEINQEIEIKNAKSNNINSNYSNNNINKDPFAINLNNMNPEDKDKNEFTFSLNVIPMSAQKTNLNTIDVADNYNFEDPAKYYELKKVIGRGTFGKVILAKDRKENKFYAIKCIKKAHIMAIRTIENIKNEKQVLEKIDNPFIIKLIKTMQSREKIFMIFDYYNGGELFFHLQKNKRFSEKIAKFYACEIYHALVYLHENSVVYR